MSRYLFKGRLCGLICDDCPEPLAGAKLRLYRSSQTQDVVSLAVAHPKDTLTLLDDAQLDEKSNRLLAETEIDAEGRFEVALGEGDKYDGGAFEIDIYCGTVPRQKPPRVPPRPRQFTVTTLQLQWRERDNGLVAAWEYCLPFRWWCWFRSLFGAWTICGKVTVCGKQIPVSGAKVSAFDADWLADDALGSAITDGAGKFRIDYAAADFKRTPFSAAINIEWTGGPDLYFKIESAGTTLLTETQTRARQPDRENAGPCFCVSLCVDVEQPPPFDNPLSTHVGDFHIYGDISNASGLTNSAVLGHGGPNYGFFGAMKLRGYCPKQIGGAPSRYRFLYEDLANPGLLPSPGDWSLRLGRRASDPVGYLRHRIGVDLPIHPYPGRRCDPRPYADTCTAAGHALGFAAAAYHGAGQRWLDRSRSERTGRRFLRSVDPLRHHHSAGGAGCARQRRRQRGGRTEERIESAHRVRGRASGRRSRFQQRTGPHPHQQLG